MLKGKFTRNTAMLDMTNSISKILILNQKDTLGILDLRSLGYYKIKPRSAKTKFKVDFMNLNQQKRMQPIQ